MQRSAHNTKSGVKDGQTQRMDMSGHSPAQPGASIMSVVSLPVPSHFSLGMLFLEAAVSPASFRCFVTCCSPDVGWFIWTGWMADNTTFLVLSLAARVEAA